MYSIWKRILCFSAIFCVIRAASFPKYENRKREKRAFPLLLYGPFGIVQFILGFGTPIPDLLMPSTTLGYFMRGIYYTPKNASDYTNPNVTDISDISRSAPITRWDIYHALEKDSEIRGHGGRPCVLRAICEAAEVPMDHYHGFFEEVFHTIFTPTSTNEPIRNHSDNEYLAAHEIGKNSERICKRLFPECKVTFLDLFTQLFSNFDND